MIVIAQPNTTSKPRLLTAKPENGGKELNLSTSSRYPRAMSKLLRMKRLAFSRWEAIEEDGQYVATKHLKSE